MCQERRPSGFASPTYGDFWAKVDRSGGADACWPWIGSNNGAGRVGYGHVQVEPGRWMGAHRRAYELLVGPIPEGMTLDHLCRNTLCVNPAHLEPVTTAENTRRYFAKHYQRSEFCHRGHRKHQQPCGQWECRECGREASRRSAAKRRAVA